MNNGEAGECKGRDGLLQPGAKEREAPGVIKGIGDTVVLGRDRQKKKSRTFTQEAQADAYLKRNGFTISLY